MDEKDLKQPCLNPHTTPADLKPKERRMRRLLCPRKEGGANETQVRTTRVVRQEREQE